MMPENITFTGSGETEPLTDRKLADVVSDMTGRIGQYLKRPALKMRALKLAATITALSGCGDREVTNNIAEPPRETEISAVQNKENNIPELAEEQNNETVSIEDLIKSETNVDAANIAESIRNKYDFDGNITIKQVNYLEDEDYLGVSIAVEGDPSEGELMQAGAFVIFKINEDNTLKLLYMIDETGEDGQITAPAKPSGISDEKWEKLTKMNYDREKEVNRI